MIENYILNKVLDKCIEALNAYFRETGAKLISKVEDIELSIKQHTTFVKNWAKEVNLYDAKSSKQTSKIAVQLNLYLNPKRIRLDEKEEILSIPITQIFEQKANHFVILGNPGAGKTTSMKLLVNSMLYGDESSTRDLSFPVVIRCRDLSPVTNVVNQKTPLIDRIISTIGLVLRMPPHFSSDEFRDEVIERIVAIRRNAIVTVLESLKVLLIVDGLDEIDDLGVRNDVLKDIRYLANHLEDSCLIVTSRTGEFVSRIDNCSLFELVPLSQCQIMELSTKWLDNEPEAKKFVLKLNKSPFADTAIRPLTLAHLLAIYERVGSIPSKPKTVYRKTVNLLLSEWDEQRSIKRTSKYAQFETDRKFEFLCRLAFHLTVKLHIFTFAHEELLRAYGQICHDFGLPPTQADQIIAEVESHTGLINEVGYRKFEFAHKSLQEYLTAEYLVKLPNLPAEPKIIYAVPNELAIAVTISSNQSQYLSELAVRIFAGHSLHKTTYTFVNRLLIEKPDLNSNPETVLALFILYSLCLDPHLQQGQKIPSLITRTLRDLNKLIESLVTENAIKQLEQKYVFEKILRLSNGVHVCEMHKRKNMLYLPRTIYVKRSYLNA